MKFVDWVVVHHDDYIIWSWCVVTISFIIPVLFLQPDPWFWQFVKIAVAESIAVLGVWTVIASISIVRWARRSPGIIAESR